MHVAVEMLTDDGEGKAEVCYVMSCRDLSLLIVCSTPYVRCDVCSRIRDVLTTVGSAAGVPRRARAACRRDRGDAGATGRVSKLSDHTPRLLN